MIEEKEESHHVMSCYKSSNQTKLYQIKSLVIINIEHIF